MYTKALACPGIHSFSLAWRGFAIAGLPVFSLVSKRKDVYALHKFTIFLLRGDAMGMSVVARGIGMMLLMVAYAGLPVLAEEAGTAAPSGQKAIRPPVGAAVSDKLSTMKNAAIKGVAMLRFESGAVGSLNFTAAQIPNKEFVYFEVTGSGGQFVTCHDFDLTVRRADGPDEVRRIGNFGGGALRELGWMGYIGDLAAFFAAVRGDAPDNSPIADAIPTMELCEEAYRQLQEQGAEP